MKKLAFFFLLFSLALFSLSGQTYSEFESGFAAFADEVADSLPFNALIGQNWSDAYIGGFPHFGAGVTLGATTIPYEAVKSALDVFGKDLPSGLSFIKEFGVMPIPAYTIDGRVGLPWLPMDVGLKAGFLPEGADAMLPDSMSMEYLLLGLDARLVLIKGNVLLPDVSVGAGYNYLSGSVDIAGIFGGTQTITDVDGHNISMSDPDFNMHWDTHVIDLRAQVSKTFLFIEPYLGAGASYGGSTAGGGLRSSVLFDGNPITQSDIDSINAAMGDDAPDLSDEGMTVSSGAGGWALRAYGGFSLRLLILTLDFTGMYNVTSGSYGGSLNIRLQL